jgi:hypothetical protein
MDGPISEAAQATFSPHSTQSQPHVKIIGISLFVSRTSLEEPALCQFLYLLNNSG